MPEHKHVTAPNGRESWAVSPPQWRLRGSVLNQGRAWLRPMRCPCQAQLLDNVWVLPVLTGTCLIELTCGVGVGGGILKDKMWGVGAGFPPGAQGRRQGHSSTMWLAAWNEGHLTPSPLWLSQIQTENTHPLPVTSHTLSSKHLCFPIPRCPPWGASRA